eukprot:UN23706
MDLSAFKNANLKGKTSSVFIRGIDPNAYEENIKEFFSDIETPIKLKHKWVEGRPGLAWATFSSPEIATRAVLEKNRKYILNRYVNTDWSTQQDRNNNNRNKTNQGPKNTNLKGKTRRIWVGNLSREETDQKSLREFFQVL